MLRLETRTQGRARGGRSEDGFARRLRTGPAAGSWLLLVILGIVLTLLGPACVWETQDNRKRDLGVAARQAAGASSASFRDTIGSLAAFQGLGPMRVQGYGLVVGLGENGATDCPPHVLNRLVQQIEKRYPLKSSRVGNVSLTPEQLIRDPDTAVVLVEGVIPGGSSVGTHFDVYVQALPDTQTKSLRGGRLFTCELEYVVVVSDPSASARFMSGRSLALSAGPVFMNPFSGDEQAATRADATSGIVLGGGVVKEDRRLRLVLAEPSASTAMQIEDRINAKFARRGKVADALSPSFVQVDVPEEFEDDATHFLLLVEHLYIPNHEGFVAERCRELAQEMVQPGAPHVAIALAFEALGDSSLPFLTPLYTHKKEEVAFHAAAAGLRLADAVAVEPLARIARNADGVFRYQAIRALGAAVKIREAAAPLRGLLDDPDPRVRIAAYEELARRDDTLIERTIVGGDNFVLDILPGSKEPLVYAKRTGERRIAIIGDGIRCHPPVFYRAPDGVLLINADDQDEELTVLRSVPRTGHSSPPVPAAPDVLPLITLLGSDAQQLSGKVTGLGVDYTTVVHALYTLCEDKSINAQFILEEPNLAEMFGPEHKPGRPESELSTGRAADRREEEAEAPEGSR